jgi:hypothetical protein
VETVSVPEAAPQTGKRAIRDFDHDPTRLTDQVMVRIVGEVVDGRPVSEVDMVDDPEPLELVQKPIDGGLVHIGLAGLDK